MVVEQDQAVRASVVDKQVPRQLLPVSVLERSVPNFVDALSTCDHVAEHPIVSTHETHGAAGHHEFVTLIREHIIGTKYSGITGQYTAMAWDF